MRVTMHALRAHGYAGFLTAARRALAKSLFCRAKSPAGCMNVWTISSSRPRARSMRVAAPARTCRFWRRVLHRPLSPELIFHTVWARAHCGASDAPPARRHWFSLFARSVRARRWPVVQADFAMLPFAADTFDLLWSNLALHWHARPDEVLTEWQRVLRKGGLLMFSTLGPDSLRELRAAWCAADAAHALLRVIPFIDMHDLGDILARSGFETPVMDMEMLTLTYRSPAALLNDVRRWGAYPCNRSLDGLTGRRRYAALTAALEAQRAACGGQIELTFEVVYGHAWKERARTSTSSPEGYGVVKLENILGRSKSSHHIIR